MSTAPITETMRVDIRNRQGVVKTGLTLDEALAYIDEVTPMGLAVVTPTGGTIPAGTHFSFWVRTMKGAVARNAARAAV